MKKIIIAGLLLFSTSVFAGFEIEFNPGIIIQPNLPYIPQVYVEQPYYYQQPHRPYYRPPVNNYYYQEAPRNQYWEDRPRHHRHHRHHHDRDDD